MRELKFRMLTQTTDKIIGYVDVYDLLRNGYDVLPDFEEAVLEGVEFEQYTGLIDKNGKEIYEGDIVKMPDWQEEPKYEIVEYRKAGFDPFQEGCMECWSPDGDEVEVIGNIHENKELLRGEE